MSHYKVKRLFLTAVLSLSLAACSNNLVNSSNGGNGKSDCGTSAECTTPPIIDPSVPTLEGKIDAGSYKGMQVITLDRANQAMVITIPVPLPIGKPIKKDIDSDKIKGAYWELKMYASNKWAIEVHIPLVNLVKGKFSDIPAALLPNGNPLPKVPSGELPGFAVKWDDGEDKELFIYLGGGTVAIFVPTYKFDPFFMVEVPIKTKKKDVVGYFITIPETEAYHGGFYLASILPKEIAQWVDDNLQ